MTMDYLFKLVLLTSAMGTVIALLVFLIKGIFINKLSPTWHYYIWVIVIIRLLVPYSLSSSYSVFNLVPVSFHDSITVNNTENKPKTDAAITPNASNPANSNDQGSINKTSTTNSNAKTDNHKMDYFKILGVLWITGASLSILYILLSYYAFAKKIKSSPAFINEEDTNALSLSKAIMGVSTNITLVYYSKAKAPALTGVINPKIILPVDTFNDLTQEEKGYVFMHELVHLKRKDIALNWVITLLLCIHWFNPILWISFNKMKKDCELSCDAETLNHIGPKAYVKYGETLIKLIKTHIKPSWTPGTTAIVNKSEIKRRIIMISKFKKKSLTWSVIAVAVTLVVGCSTLTNSKSTAANTTDKVTENQPASNSELTQINSNTKTDPTAPVKEQNVTSTEKSVTAENTKNPVSEEATKVKGKFKLYEGIYFDNKRYGGTLLNTYCEVAISNVTDTSFDFTVYQVVDSLKNKKKVIFLKNTAVFVGDGTKAAFKGKEYTINFSFPNNHNALPAVTDMTISGFGPLEGTTFVNNGIPGHEFG